MKNISIVLLLIIIQLGASCKKKPELSLNDCVCNSIDYKYRTTNFSILDTIKIKNLINEFSKLKLIEDDGRVIFGDTIFLNCSNNNKIMIEVNEDFIKLNNKKYHPQKTTTRLLRAYKGDNFTDKTISKAISNINSTKSLILRDCNLSSIPLEIFKLKNLEYLDLSINTIKSIPDGISELKNLKNLSISYNLLDQINPEISNLPKLETLWFLDNRLELIPDELCEMKNLVELNITGNPINKLPMCVPRMSRLENFYFGTFSDSLHSQSILDQIKLYKQINSNLNIRI